MLLSCALTLCWNPAAGAAEDPVLLEVTRFTIEGDNPLAAQETEAVLKPYIGRHTSLSSLEAAAAELQAAIRSRGYSFHRVIVPAQQPTAGDLRLRVLPFLLGDITVAGNQHFSTENIRRSVPGLKPGRAPNLRALSQEIGLANEHPSKRLTVQIKEGTKPDTVDADVRVRDVTPSQFFAGLTGGTRDKDNTLNRNTGYTRLTVGYQHSNLFDRDQTATLAYTTSPDHLDDVKQFGVFYTAPIYGYNTMVTAFYTYSDINTGSVGLGGQSFDVSGSGKFYGVKVTYALPKLGVFGQNVSLAWDDRYFKSNVAFLGESLPASTVRSRPVALRYALQTERTETAFSAHAEYAHNTDGGSANDDASYAAARAGARQDWDAVRFGLDGTYALGASWTLNGRVRAQYADEALISGEQLGIAGATAVRGFREREISGDKAYVLNLEAHAPAFGPGVAPFVFYDHGERRLVVPVIGTPSNETISSAGAGLRWQWQRLDVSATWAVVTNGITGGTPSGHHKVHFSAFYRF